MFTRKKFILSLTFVVLLAGGIAFAYFRFWKWPEEPGHIYDMIASPDGKRVAALASFHREIPHIVQTSLGFIGVGLRDARTETWILDVDTGHVTSVDHETFSSGSLAWRSDSSLSFVSGELERYQSLWSLTLPEARATLIDDNLFTWLTYSPDRKYLAAPTAVRGAQPFAAWNSRIVIFKADSLERLASTPSRVWAPGCRWSHDGTAIFYPNEAHNQILRFDLDSGTESLLFPAGGAFSQYVSTLVLSPDGSELAFVADGWVYRLPLSDRTARKVVRCMDRAPSYVIWNKAGIWYFRRTEPPRWQVVELHVLRDGQSRSLGTGEILEAALLNDWEIIVRIGNRELSIVNGKTGEWRKLNPQ